MKTIRIIALVVLIVGSGVSCAQQARTGPTDRATAHAARSMHGAPLAETVTVATDEPIPNLLGKRLISLIVEYPPGASSTPHRHARSAFIYAYVLSGEIRSQVNDKPARVYQAGEAWTENPGAHHRVSANASATKPARLLAVFIVDAVDEQLTIPDPY